MKMRDFKIYLCLSIVFLITFISLTSSYSFGQNPAKIAKEIIPDAGVISSFWEGKSNKVILIFEEIHISRIGQIEIALMLTRLHNRYNVNTVALEGAFTRDSALDVEWFHGFSDRYVREEIALQLLREGEISAAEFVALAIPEVKVYGVERAKEYTFELSPLDESSAIVYLYAIAEKLFPKDKDKIAHANRLAKELEKVPGKDKPAKLKELMDYVINANEWTKKQYKKLTTKHKIISTEELLTILNEIKAKAQEVNADVGQYKEHFNTLVGFYKRASKRTETIIANSLKLFDKNQGVLMPVIMGAAHSKKATEILRKQGISYAVIRPISLGSSHPSDLTIEAFERKRKKLSIDEKGLLGSFLDARWKPPPVVNQIWLRSKSELYYITTLLAHAAAKGDRPPFKSLANELSKLKYVNIDPKSFKIVEGEVIFKVTAQTNNPNHVAELWGKTVMIAHREKRSLEERLKEILEEVREKGIQVKEKNGLKIERVSRDVVAAFSENPNVINKVKLSG